MIRYDYQEFRTLVWYSKRNLNVNFATATDNDDYEFYELYATEPDGSKTYYTKINSRDDSLDVADFKQNWKDKTNLQIDRLGMNTQEINEMLVNQKLIIRELRMMNKHLASISDIRYTYQDLDFEVDKEHFV